MSNDLITSRQPFTQEQIQLIKNTCCPKASDDELRLFMYTAQRVGLDPLTKQIYAVKRWNSQLGKEIMTIQTGIDGFRLIAERSGKYAGQTGPLWCGNDGEWKDVWLMDEPPVAAKVGVMRSDFKDPLYATALFKSYAQRTKDGSLTSFWSRMPELMIGKVCEALALRKAFPQELSGIYTSEEMQQADSEPQVKEIPLIEKPEPKKFEKLILEISKVDNIDRLNQYYQRYGEIKSDFTPIEQNTIEKCFKNIEQKLLKDTQK